MMYGHGLGIAWVWPLILVLGLAVVVWALHPCFAGQRRTSIGRESAGLARSCRSASPAVRSPSRSCAIGCECSMSNEIGRRRALQIAGVGAVAVVTGGAGTWQWVVAPLFGSVRPTSGQPLREPAEMASRNGILDVQLVAGTGTAPGRPANSGSGVQRHQPRTDAAGGSWRRAPRQADQQPRADHEPAHPRAAGVPEGQQRQRLPDGRARRTLDYWYRIPADHPAGTFWYHPHHHGTVADQVFGGLVRCRRRRYPGRVECSARTRRDHQRHHPGGNRRGGPGQHPGGDGRARG